MAYDDSSIVNVVEPDLGSFFASSEHRKRYALAVGALLGVFALQLWFYIEAVVESGILPGAAQWAQLAPALQIDMFFTLGAIGAVAVLPLYKPELARALVIQRGGVAWGLLLFPLFAFAGFAAAAGLAVAAGHLTPSSLSDTTKLLYIIEFSVFVAAGEETLFRIVPDAYVRNKWAAAGISAVGFSLFHIWAYSASNGSWVQTLGQMGVAAILGLGLFVLYKLWGIMAAIGFHAGYDIVTAGVANASHVASVFGVPLVPF